MNELYALKRQNLGYVNYIFIRLLKNAVAYFVRFPGLFFSSFLWTFSFLFLFYSSLILCLAVSCQSEFPS